MTPRSSLVPGMPPEVTEALIPDNPLFITWGGSRAHGTWVNPENPLSVDDIDVLVVHRGKLEHYFAGSDMKSHHRIVREWDVTAHSLAKYVKLCLAANPNVISNLFLPESKIIYMAPAFKALRDIRGQFLTRRLINSFGGYAKSEFMKITKLPLGDKVPTHLGKRQALFTRHGYNTSSASHAIRLLQMGIEALQMGDLFPDRALRGDAEIYMAIKNGEWALNDVIKHGHTLSEIFDKAARDTQIPEIPNEESINRVLITVLCQEFSAEVVRIAFEGKQGH